ncbi:hypothetical protein QBC47DRAFT_328152 [Echria macrotheca]|uniref:Dockerin type 1 n=1 Tax=Echria macrotheca TaxID=438768 RepID=A0AAJ0B7Q8_9PEZI|nr:hypothetical protein QBC47DRAFT_328152 [Echria macrotheca]
MLSDPTTTVLGPDPAHRRCVLNGNAFQQDALISFNGWQYAAFYASASPAAPEPLYVHLARRELPRGSWEVLRLDDYVQTVDDGHNTVQMGICHGDGTIHLAYDHHCDILRFRISIPSLALSPNSHAWTPTLFSPTQSHLPGLPASHKPFHYITYPRFLSSHPSGSLYLTFRDGKAGLGNDHLYLYSPSPSPSQTYTYKIIGQFLTGINSNPYIHGLDSDIHGKIHITWVWRGFVPYDGWDDPSDTKHKTQAGPNGMENNFDLCYVWSGDGGWTWRGTDGEVVADLSGRDEEKKKTVDGECDGGVTVWRVGKGRGLMNQEAQAVDCEGGVHVLNRDWDGEDGYWWRHYYREPMGGTWTKRAVRPITGTKRGKLAVSRGGDLYLILPDSLTPTIRILKATRTDGYSSYQQVWEGGGYSGEPLVDSARLRSEDILSIFVRRDVHGETERKEVVVLDFALEG